MVMAAAAAAGYQPIPHHHQHPTSSVPFPNVGQSAGGSGVGGTSQVVLSGAAGGGSSHQAASTLGHGEVVKASGKYPNGPVKVSGKNYFRDEVVIRNSDSGKGDRHFMFIKCPVQPIKRKIHLKKKSSKKKDNWLLKDLCVVSLFYSHGHQRKKGSHDRADERDSYILPTW
jgi:hypothetical protein